MVCAKQVISSFGWCNHILILILLIGLSSFFLNACTESNESPTPSTNFSTYSYEVTRTYPHDPNAFTQGLVFDEGFLYEGTGLYGNSSLRKLDLETGTILMNYDLSDQFFGEGITIFQDTVFQLTWKSNIGFTYSKDSFEQLGKFHYATQGWGITHNNDQLIMSDGSSRLYFLDPYTLEVVRSIQVRNAYGPVFRLNELEFIHGEIYANVWQKDYIVVIDPADGRVTSQIDLTNLLKQEDRIKPVDVLNGIAYNSKKDRLIVTGKLWPKLFEIELVLLD